MRLFVAINFPDALRGRLWDASATLRETVPAASWVRHDRLHMTLAFLGDHDQAAGGRVAGALERMAAVRGVLPMRLDGVGAFPNLRRPRVVWIGAHGAALDGLATAVGRAIDEVGVARDAKPFRAHVTIGRLRRAPSAGEAAALERAASAVRIEERFEVRAVDLMESVLGAGGGYRLLATARLGGG